MPSWGEAGQECVWARQPVGVTQWHLWALTHLRIHLGLKAKVAEPPNPAYGREEGDKQSQSNLLSGTVKLKGLKWGCGREGPEGAPKGEFRGSSQECMQGVLVRSHHVSGPTAQCGVRTKMEKTLQELP